VEETLEDVRAKMHRHQDNEINQLRDVLRFLELEMRFVEAKYLMS
jgi:hypothetical protein